MPEIKCKLLDFDPWANPEKRLKVNPGEMFYHKNVLYVLFPQNDGGTSSNYFRPFETRDSTTQNLWSVTGEAPNITVHPSVNYGDPPIPYGFHGWLQEGVIKW